MHCAYFRSKVAIMLVFQCSRKIIYLLLLAAHGLIVIKIRKLIAF